MPDPRETAQRKARGQTLPQAPTPREQGPGSPLGHLVVSSTGERYTVSGAPTQGPHKKRRGV